MSLVTNWHAHPKADITLPVWNNCTITVNTDGTRTYHPSGSDTFSPFFKMGGTMLTTDTCICAIRFRETGPVQVESGSIVRDGEKDGLWVYEASPATDNIQPAFSGPDQLTPLALAIYTPEDWQTLQTLGVYFFDKDTAAY